MFSNKRGDDVAIKAKVGQDAPSGNLVDDILAGAVHSHDAEVDDLLGDDLGAELHDLDHLN